MKDFYFKVTAKGVVRDSIRAALLEKLYELGYSWKTRKMNATDFANAIGLEYYNGKWVICWVTTDDLICDALDLISGKFDLKAWCEKASPDAYILAVDLSWLRGEAREAVSKAIQDVAFSRGYLWEGAEATHKYIDRPALYIWQNDGAICYDDSFGVRFNTKEISVNQALRGEYARFSHEKCK